MFYRTGAREKEMFKKIFTAKITSAFNLKSKEGITSFGSLMWVGKKYSSCWCKVTAPQIYSPALPLTSRSQEYNSVVQMASEIAIQWTSQPRTYVLF
jgi:hypothetical protein